MDPNPYSPPTAADDERSQASTIAYRVFRGRPISFRLTSAEKCCDEVRREVQQAIDVEIGADNVVSIVEHGAPLAGFYIVVWYRVRNQGA